MAIVGAGPGGIAAALQLAAAGASVTIYEAQSRIGGRARRIDAGDFTFDCGPTFFMMPWVLEEIVAACGSTLSSLVELTRLDPMYRLLFGRGDGAPFALDATQDLARMRERLAALDPRDGPAFDRFIRETRVKLDRLTPILRRPVRSFVDLLDRDGLRAGLALRPWRSVAQELARRFTNPIARLALSFQTKYLGMSPSECPELFTILPLIEYEYGIWHPRGGCHGLMEALADLARALGVRIVTNAPVERIAFEGHRATGVVIGGESRPHEHVVINADATWALANLIPGALRPRRWSDDALGRRRYSCSSAMLYLGLSGELDLPHHTIYMSGRYEENLADITERGVLSEDPSIYCCHASRTDPSCAPKGDSALYVLVPVPNRVVSRERIDWSRDRARWRESTLDQVERVVGVRDLRARIRAEHSIVPTDWEAENIRHAAVFNLSHVHAQMLHHRVPHRMPGADGIWFVGGGTHPGSGLPVIFLSSTITTRLLCDELGLRHPLDETALPSRRYPRPRDAHLRELPADSGAARTPVAGLEADRA